METKIETRPSYNEIYQGLLEIDRISELYKADRLIEAIPSSERRLTQKYLDDQKLQWFLKEQKLILLGDLSVQITTQGKWFMSRYEESFLCFPIGKWKYQYEDYPFIFSLLALVISVLALGVSIFK